MKDNDMILVHCEAWRFCRGRARLALLVSSVAHMFVEVISRLRKAGSLIWQYQPAGAKRLSLVLDTGAPCWGVLNFSGALEGWSFGEGLPNSSISKVWVQNLGHTGFRV